MTSPSVPPEDTNLLKAVLPPLLDDFQHWFGRTVTLLEEQTLSFLSPAEQADLLARVRSAQKQVSASQTLCSITDSQVGVEMKVVMTWHKLVNECWSVAVRYRREQASQAKSTQDPTDQHQTSRQD
ncbi:DUF2605 domain-containing protein [cf. Phormidesmis sp. LEGE 11477]|uniref:DUF2605 domain-containing protein n=1 Tax=cf. Phormidesmis sp. LEGE 11477 TaxID=1828680 RepID=UPI0018808E37|nr:DUF2605 domain-containing protein [cf. Phormidesmis sp. LEGE 11477]MBE9063821.1 DUF2605 domain-containing protein [cf. Phormidesmis sp. LEGE 11477]